MRRQPVYVVYAEGEEAQAELLAQPLREAGYDVTHNGTVAVGESLIGSAMQAVTGGTPIVLCATARASGSAWAHQIVNAGHSGGRTQVFVVQMESQAFVEHLALRAKVARYCDDPAAAVRDLLAALAKHFPPSARPAPARVEWIGERMDAPTARTDLDVDAVRRFRDGLRPEIAVRHPATLEHWEFLERAGLVVDDRLTVTGVLLFGRTPTAVFPAAMVKCVRYHGPDRSALRDSETFESTVPEQITSARDFIARHVRRGERPSQDQARSVDVYDYPMIAVREIIANALVHRDYGKPDTCVHVRIFDDRLEISSPGSWPAREIAEGVELSLGDLDGQSIKRNFRLAHVLSWIRMVEGEGSGIPTSLRDCAQAESAPPTVHYDQGIITVTLRPRPPDSALPRIHEGIVLREFPVPRQLPAAPIVIVGREREAALLDDTLDETQPTAPITVITGMAGVGKTSFTLHWAYRSVERFPDGQLYVNLHGFDAHSAPLDPAVAVRGFLDALGIPAERIPIDADAQTALYRSLVAGKRLLIVLDNAATADQVTPLLPGGGDCAVLVTSRNHLAGLVTRHGARMLHLDVLAPTDAHAILVARLGPARIAAEPDAVDELVHLCGGHPLALSILAVHFANHPDLPFSALVHEMRESAMQLLDNLDVSLSAVLSWSLRTLSGEQQQVYALLGIAPGPYITVSAGAALTELTPARIRHAFAALQAASLLERRAADRFAMHDLIRLHADELAQQSLPQSDRVAAIRRVAVFYSRAAADAGRVVDPRTDIDPPDHPDDDPALSFANAVDALQWFEEEHRLLLDIQHTAFAHGWHEIVWQLAMAMTAFHRRTQRTDDDVHVWRNAVHAATYLDQAVRIAANRNLGVALALTGDYEQALDHLDRAMTSAVELGDIRAQAAVHQALAVVWTSRGDRRQALDHAATALTLSNSLADWHTAADTMGQMARHLAQLGDFTTASDHCSTAVTLHRQLGDRHGEARDLDTLGYIAHQAGRPVEAVAYYGQALNLYRELGHTIAVADGLGRLGHAFADSNRPDDARSTWQEAIKLYHAQDRLREATDLQRLLHGAGQPTTG